MFCVNLKGLYHTLQGLFLGCFKVSSGPYCAISAHSIHKHCDASLFSSSDPRGSDSLVSAMNKDLWLVPKQEVRKSRTSYSSQKFETLMVANVHKIRPSLRLRTFWNQRKDIQRLIFLKLTERGLWGPK